MPEGHTLHRAARLQTKALGTGPIRMWSPQGRFDEGARVLDGAAIRSIEAVGKHLFYHLDRRPILHVHLGLFGKFSTFKEEPYPSPSPNARLAMVGDSAVYLSGPTVCELLDAAQADRALSPASKCTALCCSGDLGATSTTGSLVMIFVGLGSAAFELEGCILLTADSSD